jgi:hypothetical protein
MTNETQNTGRAYTIVARVIRQEGHCGAGHRVGDEVIFLNPVVYEIRRVRE